MSPPRDDESPSESPDGPVRGSGSGEADDGALDDGNTDPERPGGASSDREDTGVDEGRDAEADGERGPEDRTGVPETGESAAGGTEAGVAVNGGEPTADAPPVRHRDGDESETTERSGVRTFVVDVVSSALAVLLVGALLFAVSGVWPPMVAIESSSMAPHMQTGDLVFVMEEQRFPGDGAVAGSGIVTLESGRETDYTMFQRPGDVIVYKPDGNDGTTPIIHRAMFYVEEGENWYEEADRQSIGRFSECGESPDEALPYCPAPHAGFITKGDANGGYDQAQADPLSAPVKPEWVVGTAEVRVPKLGCIRLRNERCLGGSRAATTGTTLATGTADRSAVNRSAAAR
ncbi:S26 family signal peptidase [Halosimplex rubrum]|uniref:S26 family signal peptidase n=1 Tax=Halosimplex rubrum TaxID=869889 RepID=A0A7D5TBJ6_9EURY|nr:S26 family signal peptidase [Halosimplex rubrum]QLH76456.1 S26 family signal peptidase [Halosimplex rubrum]